MPPEALPPEALPSEADGRPHALVLMVNWRQADVTLLALEGVMRLQGARITAVVCDNGSADGSIEALLDWACGARTAPNDAPAAIGGLAEPALPKPLPAILLDRTQAEAGAGARDAALVVIDTGANLGFAGGNNVGLAYALARGDVDYVWLLNNDTLVAPDAVQQLVAAMEADPGIGICGATLRYFEAPGIVQCLGGCAFDDRFASARHLGQGTPADRPIDADAVRRRLDYVMGASMFVRRRFVEEVGPLDERFFLYFEEISWARRAGDRFRLGYAPEAVVYHRSGASTGLADRRASYGGFGELMLFKNRIAFTRLYQPRFLPTVYLGLLLVLGKAVLLGRWRRVRTFLQPELWRGRPGLADLKCRSGFHE